MYLEWDKIPSQLANRIIHAAGSLLNLLTGGLALLTLRSRKVTQPASRYFLWLFATISFIIVSINHVSAPLIGGGDWTVVIRGLKPNNMWKTILVGTGIIMAIIGYILPLRLWIPDLRDNRMALLKITVIPVLTLIIVQTLSLIWSPFAHLPSDQNHLLASVFAYIHFILWAILINIIPIPRSKNPIESIRLPRSNTWCLSGIIGALFFIGILGPGLGPLEEDPRLG